MNCWLFGHRFVPINDSAEVRAMFCMKCGFGHKVNLKQIEKWPDPPKPEEE